MSSLRLTCVFRNMFLIILRREVRSSPAVRTPDSTYPSSVQVVPFLRKVWECLVLHIYVPANPLTVPFGDRFCSHRYAPAKKQRIAAGKRAARWEHERQRQEQQVHERAQQQLQEQGQHNILQQLTELREAQHDLQLQQEQEQQRQQQQEHDQQTMLMHLQEQMLLQQQTQQRQQQQLQAPVYVPFVVPAGLQWQQPQHETQPNREHQQQEEEHQQDEPHSWQGQRWWQGQPWMVAQSRLVVTCCSCQENTLAICQPVFTFG